MKTPSPVRRGLQIAWRLATTCSVWIALSAVMLGPFACVVKTTLMRRCNDAEIGVGTSSDHKYVYTVRRHACPLESPFTNVVVTEGATNKFGLDQTVFSARGNDTFENGLAAVNVRWVEPSKLVIQYDEGAETWCHGARFRDMKIVYEGVPIETLARPIPRK